MRDPLVKIEHIRAAKLCTGGARRWFAHHKLNWSKFLAEGLPASVIGQWGDPLADRAIEQAKEGAGDVG